MDRPFIHIFMGLVVGITASLLLVYFNIIIAICLVIPYGVIINKTLNKKLFLIMICYFVLGITSFNLYFNYSMPKDFVEVRLLEDRGYYIIGEANGRKVRILNMKEGFKLGNKYLLQGKFEKIPVYNKGIIGSFDVKSAETRESDFISKSYTLKDELFLKFREKLGEYNTSILMGVCYGDSSYLPYDKLNDFNTLGISHVISVSGLHTSLIYGALKGIVGYKLSLILLFLYVIFTGAKAATLRAFIMIVILVLSSKIKKDYDSISALAFAAFILLLFKPYYILDAGYCLSFLGILGIYLFYKKIRRKLYKLPTIINESLSLTIAASIFTIPYIIFIFNTLSFGGFISNLVVLPFYTFIVVLGNIALIIQHSALLFNLSVTMLTGVFSIIITAQNFLLSIIPQPLSLNYMEGLTLIFLYPTFMLIKKGYKNFIYMPIILFILVIIGSYKVFPEVNFINYGNYNVISINYQFKTLLISPEKVKLSKIYEIIKVDKIYDELDRDIEIILSKAYKVEAYKDGKEIILLFSSGEKKIKFIQSILEESPVINIQEQNFLSNEDMNNRNKINIDIDSKNLSSIKEPYDIINVVKSSKYDPKGKYFQCFKIVNGKALRYFILKNN
jgi:competence protein ComEC